MGLVIRIRNTYDLAEKEKAERDSSLQFKKSQVDTNLIEAKFPGDWNKYIDKHLLIPDWFLQTLPVGIYQATISFRITQEGRVDQVELLRSVEWSLDLEIFRTFENGPLWKPAVQFGRNVVYRQRQSLSFQISH
jgi:protein TonB